MMLLNIFNLMHHFLSSSSMRSNLNKMKINSVLQKMPEKGVALFILALGVIISVGVILVSCEAAKSEISSVAYTQEELLQRGHYLVSTSACHDCHSPKVKIGRAHV